MYLLFLTPHLQNQPQDDQLIYSSLGKVDARSVFFWTLICALHLVHFTDATSPYPSTPKISPKYTRVSFSHAGHGPYTILLFGKMNSLVKETEPL